MKINSLFPYDMFKFLHRPLRIADKEVNNFLERFLIGPQTHWEELNQKILNIQDIPNPEKCPVELLQYLKDIVGLTKDLRNITDNLSEADLRKIILLAVPLWRSKGIEVGIKNIIKLFTGHNARIFNWFDYRMIIGESAIGEEQLGEDSWLISTSGVENQTVAGLVTLLLQFNTDREIKDGSEFQNPIIPYGHWSHQAGGPFSNSKFYLRGTDIFLHAPNRRYYDFSGNFTIEAFIKTNEAAIIPLFHKFNTILNKGIKLVLNAITNEVIYTISDGVTTQTNTWAAGTTIADDTWKHIAWGVDWDESDYGKIAIWVEGTRIGYVDLDGSLIKSAINTGEDLLIGTDQISSIGFNGGLDAIRIATDNRYPVANASITKPATNWIEYQSEQLDEYQIDVRVVDNGDLNRSILKSIINLMRLASERINILYIDFYDEFVDGKGQWNTVLGSAYVEQTDNIYYLKLPENSFEIVEIQNSTTWKNYIAQHRCTLYAGDIFSIRFLVQDSLNYYEFKINTTVQKAYINKVVAGVSSSLATPIDIDVASANPPLYYPYYVFSVSSFVNENTGVITLRAFIDSNKIFEITDTSFSTGTFGLATEAGTTIWCSEVEMFQMPLDYDRINPNDEF